MVPVGFGWFWVVPGGFGGYPSKRPDVVDSGPVLQFVSCAILCVVLLLAHPDIAFAPLHRVAFLVATFAYQDIVTSCTQHSYV